MNPYFKNISRIEFVVTLACTGRRTHCSEGDHVLKSEHIDGIAAARMIGRLCCVYPIASLMTFGVRKSLQPAYS